MPPYNNNPENFHAHQHIHDGGAHHHPLVDMASRAASHYHPEAKHLDHRFPSMQLDSGFGAVHREHTSRHGDTLASIAGHALRQHGINANERNVDHHIGQIAKLNGIDAAHFGKHTHLRPGTKLMMPGAEGAGQAEQPQSHGDAHHTGHHGKHHPHHGHHHGGGHHQSGDAGTANAPGPKHNNQAGDNAAGDTTSRTTPDDGSPRNKAGQPQGEGANMSVTGPPTMSAEQIDAVLAKNHSPAAGMGKEIYDMGVKAGINPAFALAMFGMESTYGLHGAGARAHNPGNIRNGHGDRNFSSWEDGFKGMYNLLASKGYAGGGRTTVGSIISKWAPPNENDTSGYIRKVAGLINGWSNQSDRTA